jgi:predicted nucleotide-binding protein
MQPNEYYSLIVAPEPGHWDHGEGLTPLDRFHYRSVDAVRSLFSPMHDGDVVELGLKDIPALFACETHHQSPTPARVGWIRRIDHRRTGYYLHIEFDEAVPPIPQKRLQQLVDALDCRGELGSTHWSVKHVNLYRVLERNGLMQPTAQAGGSVSAAGAGPIDVAGLLRSLPRIDPPVRRAGANEPADIAPGTRHPLDEQMETIRRLQVDVSTPKGAAALLQLAGRSEPAAPGVAPTIHPVQAAALARPRVFIVHGHDVAVREEVARVVEKLGFEAVILHEQANQGRTILTKFQEEAASCAFAIVLLTGDDRGGVASDDPLQYPRRARQNVVFEFGFFAGSLGLKHVCALVDGKLEKPSDIDGLVYIPRHGNWKLDLANEMRAAGLPVDTNRL